MTADRRARQRVNDVADRRKYAAMLQEASRHGGLDPAAAEYLRRESARIDAEASAALAVAMRDAGAFVAGTPHATRASASDARPHEQVALDGQPPLSGLVEAGAQAAGGWSAPLGGAPMR